MREHGHITLLVRLKQFVELSQIRFIRWSLERFRVVLSSSGAIFHCAFRICAENARTLHQFVWLGSKVEDLVFFSEDHNLLLGLGHLNLRYILDLVHRKRQ